MPSRTDTNHAEIMDAFRRLGWLVISTVMLRKGFPDLLVAKRGVMRLVEVKDGRKSLSRRALTADEASFHRKMFDAGCPVALVESVDDVIALDAAMTWKVAS